jgi:hypothetical protein
VTDHRYRDDHAAPPGFVPVQRTVVISTGTIESIGAAHRAQAETIAQLRAEVAGLRDKDERACAALRLLSVYANHFTTCESQPLGDTCDCGYSGVRGAVQKALASPSCGNGARVAHDWKPVTGAHGIEGYGEKEDPDGL